MFAPFATQPPSPLVWLRAPPLPAHCWCWCIKRYMLSNQWCWSSLQAQWEKLVPSPGAAASLLTLLCWWRGTVGCRAVRGLPLFSRPCMSAGVLLGLVIQRCPINSPTPETVSGFWWWLLHVGQACKAIACKLEDLRYQHRSLLSACPQWRQFREPCFAEQKEKALAPRQRGLDLHLPHPRRAFWLPAKIKLDINH